MVHNLKLVNFLFLKIPGNIFRPQVTETTEMKSVVGFVEGGLLDLLENRLKVFSHRVRRLAAPRLLCGGHLHRPAGGGRQGGPGIRPPPRVTPPRPEAGRVSVNEKASRRSCPQSQPDSSCVRNPFRSKFVLSCFSLELLSSR